MVKVKEDLTGQMFGRLTVIEQAEDKILKNGTHLAMWLCECSCKDKTKKIILGSHLRQGHAKSCGCIIKERATNFCLSKHKTNRYDLDGDYGVGWTTNTNREFYFDLEDYDKIKDFCWYESINKYNGHHVVIAYVPENRKKITMHQLITCKKDMDHANQNPLDNRKDNLRKATRSQQGANRPKQSNNTSGFIGIRLYKPTGMWRSEIKVNKKNIYLGSFKNKEDALVSRLKAEAKYFKEFAPQRGLFEQYGITIEPDCDTNIYKYEKEN